MKITMRIAKSIIKKYYLDTMGFAPMNKDIVITDINGDIITAFVNGKNRQFKVTVSIACEDVNLIAD